MRLLFSAVIAVSVIAACGSGGESTGDNKDTTGASDSPSVAATPAENTLTDAEKSDGWQLLFDGTSKNGWHVYNNNSDGASWTISDGTIFSDPSKKDTSNHKNIDLVTNEEYENYHLKVDWKIDTAGNSGIIFNINEDPKYTNTYHTGPEMQVLDNARHSDAKIIKHRAGDLYDLITSSPETVKPALEWNTAEIVSNKGTLEFYLNGTKVVSTTMWDDNWKKMLAGSKFKAWKDFGTFKKGKIALQDHGNKVWYRNIKIKKL